ncbi:phosphocholine-specific phospholipase C [Actinomadura parmotrematis]|uniref:phospholipase C n=1 Tax=Actinomadura parmotrematis TaxID=2864039 RepID=A0ABS7G1D5_9ACTN|nr:phospholipase C, phosphocholine-specific [Actinomadura parmotrematis]MBW8485468.1 phospholipase C, phosphocholine-specific [Actinomadura parmotrematis]
MTAVHRRRFLQIAGGASALTLLPDSIARAAEIPAARRTGTIRDVEHIVVLMQENRSFDHYFGKLRGVRGFGDPRAVTLPNGGPVWDQSGVLPFRPDVADLGMTYLTGLNHDWTGGQKAWNNGRYDNWVPAKTASTMAHLQRADIPFHYALADAFTVCDAYHCSFIGNTDPNRYYMWTGYTGNDGQGGGPVLANQEAGYGWKTYPERLEAAGVSWKVYQDAGDGLDAAGSWGWTDDAFIGNYGDNSLLYFDSYRDAKPGDALYEKARTGTNVKAGGTYFDVLRADVKSGRLPQVSYIAAPEAYSEHPNWPVNYGAWYIAQVLDALTANPEVWSRTVLLLTYDENDGFFDHVVPPFAPASREQGLSTVSTEGEHYPGGGGYQAGPYGLGPRVPMLAISPWSKGGWVCSQTFDHTSVIRFIEERFGVREPNISPWRRAVCGDLTSAFDFASPDRRPARLPATSGYLPADKARHPSYVPPVPASPALPKQEKGTRYARPLPYALSVTAAVAPGKVTLEFASGRGAGASFYVTSPSRPEAPWSYTVGAGRRLSDVWTFAGAYDLSVHGPNGFFRRFKGDPAKGGPRVTAVEAGGSLRLTVANPGAAAIDVQLADAYRAGRPARLRLRPGQRAVHTVDLRSSASWYDVSVTTAADPDFLHRFAGHVETGRPSLSDPALG